MKILIVEDECIFAMDLKQKLTELGYAVTGTPTNYHDAVALADKDVPDLALMDINLKGEFNGIETARYLREVHNIPLLFITAYIDSDFEKKILKLNPIAILSKPLEEYRLNEILYNFYISKKELQLH